MKKNNPEIAFSVLYVDVKVTISQFKGDKYAKICKSTKQSYVSKHCIEREKLLIPNNISTEEVLSKTVFMFANFHDDK